MRKFSNRIAGLITVGSVFYLATVHAAVVYVDKDNLCPGSGTSDSPYCTMQTAFNIARPGDVIRIRDSASPYDETAIAKVSGTVTAPIIVEPDPGHRPILRFTGHNSQQSVIEIRDADYWQIRGLTFDGAGTQTSRYAVLLHAHSRDITGHVITRNAFRNWGGSGENTKAAAALTLRPGFRKGLLNLYVTESTVSENTFSNNAQGAIQLIKTKNIVIEHNTIQGMQCGRKPDNRAGATGIKDSQGSIGTIIRYNTVYDHQRSEECVLPNQGNATYFGIYCDTGSTDGEIIGNVVYNIDKGRSNITNSRATGGSSVGIFIESRCNDWSVHGNLVYNVGGYGLRNGSRRTGDPNRTKWTNNTVYGTGRNALWVVRGRQLTVKNNILVHNQANAAIELTKTAVDQGPHTIDRNLYWDMQDGTRVGRWGDNLTLNLANWRRSCECDAAALTVNPLFLNISAGSEDFRLSSSSPARGIGEGSKDLGAYPSVLMKR